MYSFGSESTIPHAMNSLLFSTLRLVFLLTLLASSVASVRLPDLVYAGGGGDSEMGLRGRKKLRIPGLI